MPISQLRRERIKSAVDIAHHLNDTETAIDVALEMLGSLIQAIPAARRSCKVSAAEGQEAIDAVIEAAQGLNQARRKLGVDAHGAFLATSGRIGVPETSFGSFPEKSASTEEVVLVKAA